MALTDRFGRRVLFIAGLSAIHVFRVVAAQEVSLDISGFSDPTNPQSTIYLSADGGICSWSVPLRERILTNRLEGCEGGLLEVVLTVNSTDTTGQVEWHRISGTTEFPVRFEGIDNRSGIRVLRSYAWTADSRALRHVLRVELSGANSRRFVQAEIGVSSDIAKHISNDRSLGDFFYGYSRIFSRPLANSGLPSRVTGATQSDWVSVVTRHSALILRIAKASPESSFSIEPGPPLDIALASVLNAGPGDSAQALDIEIELTMLPLTSVVVADHDLEPLLYSDAWWPIRHLTQGIDLTLDKLSGAFGNVGVAVIFFAVLIRIMFFPLTLWSMRQQKLFSAAEKAMRPTVKEINETMKGEEKSERLLALYKEHGVSPFSGLKGSVALFVQIPILLALFNVTAESAIFRDMPFLWASDLSLPDQAVHLPFIIPMFGGSLNLLPIALGAVNLLSGSIESKQESTSTSSNRTATILTILILVFFYSCAAALVLYWLTINVMQIAERQYIRRSSI